MLAITFLILVNNLLKFILKKWKYIACALFLTVSSGIIWIVLNE